jgi:hypothetical protein
MEKGLGFPTRRRWRILGSYSISLRNEREERTHDLTTGLLRGHANILRTAPSVETRSAPEPNK